ncbi:MAG: DUF4340 domain-containing protein [Verrucomicrobia bacterium]|nr:DUF4340 domain-containing protein [Verrucomicrobiota bacterium]MBI3871218.1 DUF4340 domain-containing protein [Verrucomicrobiota bacterium]
MKWRSTLWLLGAAVGMFLLIWGYERHTQTTDTESASQPLLPGFRARDVSSLQIHRTNSFFLQIQRTNGGWDYIAPFSYPALAPAVDQFLLFAEGLNRDFLIAESLDQTTNRFGLDRPQALVTWVQGPLRVELRLGSRTLSGDQVYAQLVGAPGVFALPGRLLDLLPATVHDWREASMIHWKGLNFNRLSVSNASRGFTLAFSPSNHGAFLLKPFQARADNAQVSRLLVGLGSAEVASFVSDAGRVDWETYGLQPPALELSVSIDTNQLVAVHFGGAPAKDPRLIYARLSGHSNLVTVPRAVLDSLQLSFEDLRDTRLLSFQPDRVDSLEVHGVEEFTVRRQDMNEWVVTPGGLRADASLVRDVLSWMQNLTIIEFSKDFVTDFSPYRLEPATYSWILRGSSTNAGGAVTNSVLAQFGLGGSQNDKVFARRPDESSVYAVRLGDALKLPDASWKLRDRRVWSFATNEVTQVLIEKEGRKSQIRRAADGSWATPAGKLDNFLSIEETVHRIGQLRASVWTARGETNRAALGFVDNGHRLTFDVKRGDKAESLSVEFGARAPSLYTYAGVKLDGEWWFFEFPFDLYFMVLRDLSIPKPLQP